MKIISYIFALTILLFANYLGAMQVPSMTDQPYIHTDSYCEQAYLEGKNNPISAIDFFPDGKRIVVGYQDGTIEVWDYKEKHKLALYKEHSGIITALKVVSDHCVLSASYDTTIKMWDFQSQKIKNIFSGHTQRVTDLALLENSQFFYSSSADGTIKQWNYVTGLLMKTLSEHENEITSLSCTLLDSDDNAILVSGSLDKKIIIWNAISGSVKAVIPAGDSIRFVSHLAKIEDMIFFVSTIQKENECIMVMLNINEKNSYKKVKNKFFAPYFCSIFYHNNFKIITKERGCNPLLCGNLQLNFGLKELRFSDSRFASCGNFSKDGSHFAYGTSKGSFVVLSCIP